MESKGLLKVVVHRDHSRNQEIDGNLSQTLLLDLTDVEGDGGGDVKQAIINQLALFKDIWFQLLFERCLVSTTLFGTNQLISIARRWREREREGKSSNGFCHWFWSSLGSSCLPDASKGRASQRKRWSTAPLKLSKIMKLWEESRSRRGANRRSGHFQNVSTEKFKSEEKTRSLESQGRESLEALDVMLVSWIADNAGPVYVVRFATIAGKYWVLDTRTRLLLTGRQKKGGKGWEQSDGRNSENESWTYKSGVECRKDRSQLSGGEDLLMVLKRKRKIEGLGLVWQLDLCWRPNCDSPV